MADITRYVEAVDDERAKVVLAQLEQIRDSTKNNFLTLCSLLLEAYEGRYNHTWGYPKFGDWIDNCGLEISGRNAYYYVGIAKRSRELGVPIENLTALNISSLKEIFSLRPSEYGEQMKALLSEAEDLSVEEVENRVQRLKAKEGDEIYTKRNFKLPESVSETLDEAFELVRRLNGSVVNEWGDVVELSDSKCLEYIAAQFLLDPNNHEQGETFAGCAVEIEDEVRIAQ